MKLATPDLPLLELKTQLKNRFAEFNRHSLPSRSRKYPADLRELIYHGHATGISQKELGRLSGMSSTAISSAISQGQVKPVKARRLEVVGAPIESQPITKGIIIRLPSGVSLELADTAMLTASLLQNLAGLAVNHAASC